MEAEPLSKQEMDAFMSGLANYIETGNMEASLEIVKNGLPCEQCPFTKEPGETINDLSELLITGQYFCQGKQQQCVRAEEIKSKYREM